MPEYKFSLEIEASYKNGISEWFKENVKMPKMPKNWPWSKTSFGTSQCSQRFWNHSIEGFEDVTRPLIIAHRGASGDRPAHSIKAYQLAIEHGADIIECDVGVTKDKEMVCLHDSYLSTTTNIETLEKFATRRRVANYRGSKRNDWWSVDFDLSELKELRLKQDNSLRNPAYDGLYAIATLQEYINVAKDANKVIGIYPEIKTPEFYQREIPDFDFSLELANVLNKNGYQNSTNPAFVQSFDFESLEKFRERSNLPLIYLFGTGENPNWNDPDYDWSDYPKWQNISNLCYGIGPNKRLIVTDKGNEINFMSNLIPIAHSHGLKVHPYTFRNENPYLLYDYGADPSSEYDHFYDLGIDGYFTDFSKTCANYLDTKIGIECDASSALSASTVLPMLLNLILIFLFLLK